MASAGVSAGLVALVAGALVVAAVVVALWVWSRRRRGPRGEEDDDDAGRGAALRFLGGPLAGQSFQLEAEVTTVGSVPGATIVLADPDVSGKHLGIKRHTDRMVGFATGSGRWSVQYELADLGSIHGVSVNGQRMAKRVLASGDIIRLGTSEMVFRIEKVG